MKILKIFLSYFIYVALGGFIFSSCNKDNVGPNSENIPVDYDAMYVVNRADNSLSVINLSTEKVEKTINLPASGTMMGGGMMGGNGSGQNMWPYHISLSPDKSKLAITEPGTDFSMGYDMMSGAAGQSNQGSILILDAITGKQLKELSLEGMPYDVMFSPDGKEIWTTLMMPAGKVKVFDNVSYDMISSITVGNMPAGMTFSDDGNKIFVANGISGSLNVIDTYTKMITDTIAAGAGTVGVFPGMQGMMYTDNQKNQTINIFNGMNDMMSDSIHLGFVPGMISRNTSMNQLWATDPDAGKMHYWNHSSAGYTYGGAVTVGAGAGVMVFSKSGSKGYVTNENDNSVSVVDIAGMKEMMRIPVGARPNGLIIRYK